jgi:hypothetical protein
MSGRANFISPSGAFQLCGMGSVFQLCFTSFTSASIFYRDALLFRCFTIFFKIYF